MYTKSDVERAAHKKIFEYIGKPIENASGEELAMLIEKSKRIIHSQEMRKQREREVRLAMVRF